MLLWVWVYCDLLMRPVINLGHVISMFGIDQQNVIWLTSISVAHKSSQQWVSLLHGEIERIMNLSKKNTESDFFHLVLSNLVKWNKNEQFGEFLFTLFWKNNWEDLNIKFTCATFSVTSPFAISSTSTVTFGSLKW